MQVEYHEAAGVGHIAPGDSINAMARAFLLRHLNDALIADGFE